ncbi:MAG: choline BCCT transporter BetT [Brachybacterium sp.]|nr:choline BCCT transporter BetT [Brachybacterium sp.]
MPAPDDAQRSEEHLPAPGVERGQFGATERRTADRDTRPPSSSTELRTKGPADFADRAQPRINWLVFISASLIILTFSLWAILSPDHAAGTMNLAVDWISVNLGWFYVLTITLAILFVLWVAFSKEGGVRLGPDHSRPQYNLFTWVSMLFAAGVGIDMLFYSVTGPVTQYIAPPSVTPESAEAAQDAVIWTMFHYGIAGWSVYALLGMAMGYFAYRWGMPLSIRAALYPLLGKRVRGRMGDAIDIFALVGTVFGVATSMGIGVVLLNVGFSVLFGLPEGLALQIALVAVAVLMTIAACTSGVDKGIRMISELNLWVAGAMIAYILISGNTAFLLSTMVENIGRFVFTLPARTLETFGYVDGGAEWMSSWTLFFWAFWLAWGPFVGLFLARISRGRTLREFVIAAITAPVLCDFLIVTIFGNSALRKVLDGDSEFAALAMANPQHGWYALLQSLPGASFLIGLATLSGMLFYLTSANSGAMVMANFSSSIPDPAQDGAKWLRIYWALVTAVLTIGMLIAGGVRTMELATLIFALPVTIIVYLVMASFSKVLRMERAEREGITRRTPQVAAHGGHAPEKTWRQRLAQVRSYPTERAVARFETDVIFPALRDVSAEFTTLGYTASLTVGPGAGGAISEYTLMVTMPEGQRDFQYRVAPVQAAVPTFGARSMSRGADVYYRVEVFTQTGSEGYDLMGLTSQQVIDDVIDRYEAHLAFLQYSNEHAYESVITPTHVPHTDPSPHVPEEPDDVEPIEDRQ